ncbi:MAG: prepilin-type N-terminal cleavage/methylation domain-containing protein [Planctomycetota bacterium]|jgi:prepilin-type N-terminal cleavage/methylation domain-containing protein
MKKGKGFTLIELMVIILIVGILSAVSLSIIRGRIESAKWSEAVSSAGAIKTGVRAYITEKGQNFDYSGIETALDVQETYKALGFSNGDLTGSYFNQSDFSVSNIDAADGTCVVTATSSTVDGPTGTGTLSADGTWSVTGN